MATRFNHLNVPNQWRHYWTKYPEGYTILESLLNWVGQVDDMVDNVNNWNEYLDEFVETWDDNLKGQVTDTLSDWQESGFLDVVIDEALQTKMDTLEQELADIGNMIGVNVDSFERLEGESDDAPRINRAYQSAGDNDKVVFNPGKTYTIGSEPVIINKHTEGTGATLEVDGNFSVEIGDKTNYTELHEKTFYLPDIIQLNKTWGGSDYGLNTINLYECNIHISAIKNFSEGLRVSAFSNANAYNNYYVTHLYNNKINLKLVPENEGGWTNENNFYLNRLSHEGSEGTDVVGVRHIAIMGGHHPPNNNVFYKPSIEGWTAEYKIECHGSYNMFINGRYESKPNRILFTGEDARSNTLFYGYSLMTTEIIEENGARYNHVYHQNSIMLQGTTNKGQIVLSNTGGQANPTIIGLGTDSAHVSDVTTDYAYSLSALVARFKQIEDAFPKVEIDYQGPSINFGDGTAEPTGGFNYINGRNNSRAPLFMNGKWDGNHIIMGSHHIWEDGNGDLRSKAGTPQSQDDGVRLGKFGNRWDEDHIQMGNFHLWFDSGGVLYTKFGEPTSETDGTIVGNQGGSTT